MTAWLSPHSDRGGEPMKSISNQAHKTIISLLENYCKTIEPTSSRLSEERRKVIKTIKYLKK